LRTLHWYKFYSLNALTDLIVGVWSTGRAPFVTRRLHFNLIHQAKSFQPGAHYQVRPKSTGDNNTPCFFSSMRFQHLIYIHEVGTSCFFSSMNKVSTSRFFSSIRFWHLIFYIHELGTPHFFSSMRIQHLIFTFMRLVHFVSFHLLGLHTLFFHIHQVGTPCFFSIHEISTSHFL